VVNFYLAACIIVKIRFLQETSSIFSNYFHLLGSYLLLRQSPGSFNILKTNLMRYLHIGSKEVRNLRLLKKVCIHCC